MTEGPELWRDAGSFGLLTTEDVARLSGFSRKTVRRAIKAGELVASSVRGEYRIWPEDFRRWIDCGRVACESGGPRPARRSDGSSPGSLDRLRALEAEQ